MTTGNLTAESELHRLTFLRMRIVQHQRQLMQRRVAKAGGLDRLHGGEHIVAVDAGLSMALQHVAKLLEHITLPGRIS